MPCDVSLRQRIRHLRTMSIACVISNRRALDDFAERVSLQCSAHDEAELTSSPTRNRADVGVIQRAAAWASRMSRFPPTDPLLIGGGIDCHCRFSEVSSADRLRPCRPHRSSEQLVMVMVCLRANEPRSQRSTLQLALPQAIRESLKHRADRQHRFDLARADIARAGFTTNAARSGAAPSKSPARIVNSLPSFRLHRASLAPARVSAELGCPPFSS